MEAITGKLEIPSIGMIFALDCTQRAVMVINKGRTHLKKKILDIKAAVLMTSEATSRSNLAWLIVTLETK